MKHHVLHINICRSSNKSVKVSLRAAALTAYPLCNIKENKETIATIHLVLIQAI